VRSNKFSEHLLVLPEDDANREIANGFLLDARVNAMKVQVLPTAGGWAKALSRISDHANDMHKLLNRRLLVLIDFDNDLETRWRIAQSKIPQLLQDRIYVLGVASQPEKLSASLGKGREVIGAALASVPKREPSFGCIHCSRTTQSKWHV
jgi:hypothetical protein